MVAIHFTQDFKRRLKKLKKRYRQIRSDLQPVLDEIGKGNFVGDQISGTSATIFKVRAKNSDIPTGKSGGYRVIYQVMSQERVLLLLVYAKSDQADVSSDELKTAIKQALEE